MVGETIMWVLAYLFLGFWSVYRILVFSDISGKSGMPDFAVLGLLAGRLGEAAGTLGADLFTGTPLILLAGALFALVIAFSSRFIKSCICPPLLRRKKKNADRQNTQAVMDFQRESRKYSV